MMTRGRKIEAWFVVVLVGLFVVTTSAAGWAKSEPAKKPAVQKAAAKPAEKPAAKKPASDAKEAKELKKAEPAKKPADVEQPKKASILSKLLGGKTGKKASAGPATVKIGVKVQTSAAKPQAKPTAAAKQKPVVVRLRLTGSYPEAPESPSPFAPQTRSLLSLLAKLKDLGEDKNVAAVVLEIETDGLGSGKIHEIREAIGRLRAKGKPVYAFLTSADGGRYLVASACDEVLMIPSGILMIPGVRAETMFYKGLLDKLGVQFQVLQMGKYKGAGEPMSRTSMSGPLRESIEAVVDDRYEWFVRSVAKDRKMEDYQVKTAIDQAFYMADGAKKAGLVDQVVYLDAFLAGLPKKLKVKDVKVVSAYKPRTVEVDLSGIGGMMKLMQMIAGGAKAAGKAGGKKIAVVYAVGPIVEGKSADSILGGSVLGSTTLVEALKTAADDKDVVGVVLRIDSPGGSGVASDLIWRQTRLMEKPLVASMGDVAGSGGYYIAMGADKILAEPGTITGSIGVIGGKLVLGGLYKKLGLTTEVIARGKRSGVLSSTDPFRPEDREGMMSVLRSCYRQCVTKAAAGRKMSYDQLHKLAQGRIYSGEDAVTLGLVDRLGTLNDAIAEVKKAAGLKKEEKVQLVILPRPKTFFEQLFEDPAASSTDAMTRLAGPLGETLRELPVIERMAAEPVLLWMPFRIEMR